MSQQEGGGGGGGGELPIKKRKSEIIIPSNDLPDEGLGSMSPEPVNVMAVSVVSHSDTIADLKRQLDKERSMRLLLEEQIRLLEHQIYQVIKNYQLKKKKTD